ncbi:hypothetical protein BDV93DRAFT_523809 [Ceratobasidium sp. AG-I]|nr:hypothetical protein BDV93DRAFT_523809 [Ceratobasidium sp. AG-I]
MSYNSRRRAARANDAVGSDDAMPDHSAQSPSSSVSSLSGSEVVFSQPALAASRENDVLVDLDNDDGDRSNVFSWPAVESPAAHASPMRPTHRALLLGGTATTDATLRSQSASSSSTSALLASNERRRQAIAIALGRETEQTQDPSTSLARRIAARQAARLSANNHEPEYPTARFLSRTTIPTSEPEPPADLRRLATTREAERQLHYRDWHRLGLLDPSTSISSGDAATVASLLSARPSGMVYARRRPSASTTRSIPTTSDPTLEEQEDDDVLTMDVAHRLRRRMAALDALDPISDAQLDREHDSATPISTSGIPRNPDRRTARRPWLGLASRSLAPTESEDGRNDPNGENTYIDDGSLTTPAARSRYWHALSNAASEDLLALAAERMSRTPTAPPLPPGLAEPSALVSASPTPTPKLSVTTATVGADPLPSPLETMILPTPRQRFAAAFRATPGS